MIQGLLIAAAFLVPVLLLIWLSRRPRRPSLFGYFIAVGGTVLSWGVYSVITRPGWASFIFILQGLSLVLFGNEQRRATRSVRSAKPEV